MKNEWPQYWNNVKFEHGLISDADFEFAVVEYGSRQSLVERLVRFPKAKEQLQKELKEIKKEEGKTEPKSIQISFEGKGGLHAVILMGECSTFSLHECMRKTFVSGLKPEAKNEINGAVKKVNFSVMTSKNTHEILSAFSSLALIARYTPQVFGKKQSEQKELQGTIVGVHAAGNKKQNELSIKEGQVLGFCNNQVKYLADLPSNVLNPKNYRERAQEMAKELRKQGHTVDFEFYDKKELKKRGAGAYLAVIQADLNEDAGIVHLRWKGPKKPKAKVALVGKGLCFDTGGYNVKTGDYMYNMHRDMTGSAVVLSLFRALVELEAPYEIDCYLALAENLISHEGYRPNDVVVAANGVSIEVIDTDAEGRMVLSDTLALASEKSPDLIIDFATLTGSVVRALDTRRCGAYSNQMKLSKLAVEVGDQCGERVWNFPIGDDYLGPLKSDTADIRQCSSSVSADHIYAATFLSHFVAKKTPWIHIDLAADTNKGGLGLVPSETTGFGVRFGYHLVQEFLK